MEAVSSSIVQIIAGWLLADFIGGLFHWWEDRVGDVGLPILGELVIIPNRVHHINPLDFTKSSLIKRNAATWLATALVSGMWLWLAHGPSPLWASATVGGLVVNEVHVYAHLPLKAPRWLSVLQDMGVVQSPQEHARHHRRPQDRCYCVLTDFLNPVLDGLGFWVALELALERAGMTPNRGQL